jgi:hypothetical protein
MRKSWLLLPLALLTGGMWLATQVSAAKAVDGSQFAGKWTGSWEGGGTGKFDLTLQTGADGSLAGNVDVGTDGGDYAAKLKNPVFTGNKLVATYDYPLDEQGEIAMTATFDQAKADGSWALGPKGQVASNPMATGTFTVTKK